MLAIIAAKTWKLQSVQAERDELRSQVVRSQGVQDQLGLQLWESTTELEETRGPLISRGHIQVGGIGRGGQNIAGTGDLGTGIVSIYWVEAYSNSDYILIVSPARGRAEFEKYPDSVTIRLFDSDENLIDVDFDVLAIGSSTPDDTFT